MDKNDHAQRLIARLYRDEIAIAALGVELSELVVGTVQAVKSDGDVQATAEALSDWLTERFKQAAALTDTIQMLYYYAAVFDGSE